MIPVNATYIHNVCVCVCACVCMCACVVVCVCACVCVCVRVCTVCLQDPYRFLITVCRRGWNRKSHGVFFRFWFQFRSWVWNQSLCYVRCYTGIATVAIDSYFLQWWNIQSWLPGSWYLFLPQSGWGHFEVYLSLCVWSDVKPCLHGTPNRKWTQILTQTT